MNEFDPLPPETPAPEPPPWPVPYRQTVIHRLPYYVPPPADFSVQRPRLSFGQFLKHAVLFGVTGLTMIWAYVLFTGWESLGAALLYAFVLMVIITAHELGHYIACRWHDVDATLPFFIPSPFPPVGTFGAFIKIKSPIPSRKALFDIGIAGPLAGFAFALPVAALAHYFAEPSSASMGDGLTFNDPLLFKFFLQLFHLPPHLALNPLWFAAWVGLFMTALNLLPIGQLDGGHVIYAIFGERGHRLIAIIVYAAVLVLAVYAWQTGGWLGWVVYAVLLTIMMRAGHPQVLDETEPLGLPRILIAIIGLLVFLLCFMPMPISM